MTLKEYVRKRDFSATTEPRGGSEEAGKELTFVVQKHSASQLHYDLRLEARGVLKSWAVPKGPSLDPADSRLAMMVEDHPLEYAGFEGNIPPGNYGAGTVMIWDEGTYRPLHADGDPGEAVERGIREGKLSFVLEGRKLRGVFHLFRMKRRGRNAWLLKKKADAFASGRDIAAADRSVKSGRSLPEIGEAAQPEQGRLAPPELASAEFAGAPRGPMPHRVRPMLATLVEEPFSREGWFFEVKWDGYRAIAEISPDSLSLYSRNGNDFKSRFPSIVRSLRRLDIEAVFDGEIVAVDHEGRADFQLLQNYLRTGKGILVYYVFDLLYLQGHDLRGLPLAKRKQLLSRVLPFQLNNVKFSSHVEGRGLELFRFVEEKRIEGMMAKDAASPYEEGTRGIAWQKIKAAKDQEAVIGGFTAPRGGRKGFGSLLLGVFNEKGKLAYIGHSGGGFSDRQLGSLYRELSALAVRRSPFINLRSARGVTWVEPRLVCEVRFTEWTDEGLMRHPVFLRLRPDKDPKEVVRGAPAARRYLAGVGNTADETVKAGNREMKISNPGKVFWPDEGYTKRDLVDYYLAVSGAILPFLRDRPESLHRYPDGIYGKDFYHKDVGGLTPGWMRTFTAGGPDGDVTYMVCQDEASLLFMINLGCIDVNPWNSRVQRPGFPDYMVFDFDPLMVPFSDVIEAVLVTRDVLEHIGCKSFCKTSGATGMHVYVPLDGRYAYLQVREFAELVNRYVNSLLPSITSLQRMPRKREKKVYLDFLQNAEGKTMAAPYSARPKEKATVSFPLDWKEVGRGLDPAQFTIRSVPEMIKGRRGIWDGVLGKGVDLARSLDRLAGLYKGERHNDGHRTSR